MIGPDDGEPAAQRRRFARLCRALLPMLLMLAACAERALPPSSLDETMSRLDFSAPARAPGRPGGQPAAGDGAATAAAPGPEVWPGRPPAPALPQRPSPVRRTAGGVLVNFDNASIEEAAKVILRDLLGATYTIHPGVSGTVTVATTAPLSEEDLLRLFETVLRMNGAALVDAGGSYAIVPADQVLGRPEIAPLGGQPPELRPGFGVTVVPLRHLAAETAAQLLQPMLQRVEDIRLDAARNLLLITGDGAERQYAVDMLQALDVDWMAGRSVGLFPLRHSAPESLIAELEAILLPPPESGERPAVRFLPVTRLNAVLAIARTPEQIAQVREWVTRLDRGERAGVRIRIYELEHVPAKEMAALLNEALGGLQPAAAAATQPAPAVMTPESGPNGGGPGGGVPVEEQPPAAAATAAPGLPGSVKIVPVEATNALLVRAPPALFDAIEATLGQLDRPPLQVLIEASIVEVLLTDQLRYGVQYFLDTANLRLGFNTTGTAGTVPKTGLEPLARLPGFNFIYTGGNANITIDALSRLTDLRVLSSPSLVVEDNREAELTVGDDVPIVTRTAQSVTNPEAPVVNNVEYRSTGVILRVKPRINSAEVVSLEIEQEVSRVVESTQTQAAGNPTIQIRKIRSRVNIASGQTVVLGGLIQDSDSRSRNRVPVLGDVPLLGHLFRSTDDQGQRTELLVFLTPKIIASSEDARRVSEELRARMRSFAPLMRETPAPTPATPAPPAPAAGAAAPTGKAMAPVARGPGAALLPEPRPEPVRATVPETPVLPESGLRRPALPRSRPPSVAM